MPGAGEDLVSQLLLLFWHRVVEGFEHAGEFLQVIDMGFCELAIGGLSVALVQKVPPNNLLK